MDMGMQFEFLAPGMQHAEEADLCAEMSRIASDFEKCFGTGAEQQTVDDFLVLQRQRSQVAGQCEDHVDVAASGEVLVDALRSSVPEQPV